MPGKRRRSSSRGRLVHYERLVSHTILKYQDPVTGLLPAFLTRNSSGTQTAGHEHAWVRDNVYGVMAIWGMAIAYRRVEGEEDKLRAHELEQNAVKLMRSLLLCMLKQADRVEKFKKTLHKESALHAKYHQRTCSSVVGDCEWGHLQIDATSLFLLMLAQMTASGLHIVYNLDEVTFVQNLVYYIEEAYRIPDYGIWERGDKTNHGQTELNSSSIGMAKAALEAMSGLDLFGARGGPSSVIHVLPDQVAQCAATLRSLLPRESSSKEIDAGLLSIIGFPAFAVESTELIDETHKQILDKLLGNYGCRRFLRDGYLTVKEDSSRLHYEPAELKIFENIECEWPLFLTFLLIDAIIQHKREDVKKYRSMLDNVVVSDSEGLQRLPELYYVPWDKVDAEYRDPHSQERMPGWKTQTMWGQSLFVLAGLLEEGLINIGEIDPLNRRLSTTPRPDPLVQVVLLAEDAKVAANLANRGILTETIQSVEKDPKCPVKILPARFLSTVYGDLGRSNKLKLSGRPEHPCGALCTSTIYSIDPGQLFTFTPAFLDHGTFYLCMDNQLLADLIRTDLAYLKSNWRQMGFPTVTLPLFHTMLGEPSSWEKSSVFRLLLEIKNGYTNGVRVTMGSLSDFISTSHIVPLAFLDSSDLIDHRPLRRRSTVLLKNDSGNHQRLSKGTSPLAGIVRRSRATPTAVDKMFSRPSPLTVAAAWSVRRQSYGGGGHLMEGSLPSSSSESSLVRKEISSLGVKELIDMLCKTSSVFEQADILHCLYSQYGGEFDTLIEGQNCTVEKLLEELYEKVCVMRIWSLVRHIAGMLNKKVDDLSQVATDLLARQKHFSVGPPRREIHITQPLLDTELMDRVSTACGKDHSSVALTQEILVYLAMFIRAEPQMFVEMLRLRIGLIQNVMVSELAATIGCSTEDAMERLLELAPFELKGLLHNIFSRKEFCIDKFLPASGSFLSESNRQLSIVTPSKRYLSGQLHQQVEALGGSVGVVGGEEGDRLNQWRRRRRLDGALNRVPTEFYSQVWKILEKCEGLSIGSQYLPSNPTIHEMTPGELKFALRVESVLNSLPNPEYRQLVVEVLIMCGIFSNLNPYQRLHRPLVVEDIIAHANQLFLSDQLACDGIATQCCCHGDRPSCGGYNGVCVHLYNSAPSGAYGTMAYISQALVQRLSQLVPNEQVCRIS